MKKIIERLNLIHSLEESQFGVELAAKYQSVIPKVLADIKEKELSYTMYRNFPEIQETILKEPKFIDYLIFWEKYDIYTSKVSSMLKNLPADKKVTDFTKEALLTVLQNDNLGNFTYDFLRYFDSAELNEEQKQLAIQNLCAMNCHYACRELKLSEFNDEEREFIYNPVFEILPLEYLTEMFRMLSGNEWMYQVVRLLYRYDISEFYYSDYEKIEKQNVKVLYEKLQSVMSLLGTCDSVTDFLALWRDNGCSEYELEILVKRLRGLSAAEIQKIFQSRAAYINFIFGSRICNLELDYLSTEKEELLIYAITARKNGFLRLIEENPEEYIALSPRSILFSSWFRDAVNINSLNKKNLICFKNLLIRNSNEDTVDFRADYAYTFDEVKTLYLLPDGYTTLYHMLDIPRIDDKLIVIRQLGKRGLLDGICEDDYRKLAQKLSQKHLYRWMNEEFSHIKGLGQESAVKLLVSYEEIYPFLSEIANETEAIYVVRNAEVVQKYTTLQEVKDNLLQIDSAWQALCKTLEIDQKFIEAHSETIFAFLAKNGAEIALTYYRQLDDKAKESYRRIVMAELMGKFYELKYHSGDLKREIGYFVTEKHCYSWTELLDVRKKDVFVKECDGFFETMMVGVKPQRTCMSYVDGAYNQCLLSNFDSNKHILYAYIDGEPVARALLRLTKGSFQDIKNASKEFMYVDLESNDSEQRVKVSCERLTLFLELSYSTNIDLDKKDAIDAMFIELAEKKAKELDCLLVLSVSYEAASKNYTPVMYYLYISRSKAGEQYFDSLGGSCSVSNEQSYRGNRFLIADSVLVNS